MTILYGLVYCPKSSTFSPNWEINLPLGENFWKEFISWALINKKTFESKTISCGRLNWPSSVPKDPN
jgi:hypothetical protein